MRWFNFRKKNDSNIAVALILLCMLLPVKYYNPKVELGEDSDFTSKSRVEVPEPQTGYLSSKYFDDALADLGIQFPVYAETKHGRKVRLASNASTSVETLPKPLEKKPTIQDPPVKWGAMTEEIWGTYKGYERRAYVEKRVNTLGLECTDYFPEVTDKREKRRLEAAALTTHSWMAVKLGVDNFCSKKG